MNTGKTLKNIIEDYSDFINYDEICEVLDIPSEAIEHKYVIISDMNVEDEECIIAMFHYRQDLSKRMEDFQNRFNSYDQERIKRVRGKAILLNDMSLVCGSYPFTCEIPMTHIQEEGPFESPAMFRNDAGEPETIQSDDIICNLRIIGTALRLFRVNDRFFLASHKKIVTTNSKFGESEPFEDLFFKQNVIRTKSELFDDIPEDVKLIYMFMVSSPKLNIDSRQIITEDKVYFLTCFKIEDSKILPAPQYEIKTIEKIMYKNESCSRPIYFPTILSRSEANNYLNPNKVPIVDTFEMTESEIFDYMLSRSSDRSRIQTAYFQPSEDIIVRTSCGGIYTVTSQASSMGKKLIDGKTNIMNIFCNLVGASNEGVLESEYVFVPYGIPEEKLSEMSEIILSGNFPNFQEMEQYSTSILEDICTNLLFKVPISLVDKVPSLINEYSIMVQGAINFIFSRRDDLYNFVKSIHRDKKGDVSLKDDNMDNIVSYIPIKKKVNLRNYFLRNFIKCFIFKAEVDVTPKSTWAYSAVESYKNNMENLKKLKQKEMSIKVKNSINLVNTHMRITAFVSNADSCMYTLLNIKRLIESFEESLERNKALKEDI